jgi:WD40 repeat protein
MQANIVVAVKAALETDEPYQAWSLIREAYPSLTKTPLELLGLAVPALESICSDLDEHGSANLDHYGQGKHSVSDFKKWLSKVKDLILSHRFANVPPWIIPSHEPIQVVLGEPIEILNQTGPIPHTFSNKVAEGFVSFSESENADGDKLVVLRDANGMPFTTIDIIGLRSNAVSRDGTHIAIGTSRGAVHLYDVQGKHCWSTETQKDWVWCVPFSPDGLRVASGGQNRIEIYQVETGSVLTYCTPDDGDRRGFVQSLFWSEDGSRLVTEMYAERNTKRLKVFDASNLTLMLDEQVEENTRLIGMLDNRCMVAHNYNNLYLLDIATGRMAAKTKMECRIEGHCLSEDKKLLFTLHSEKAKKLPRLRVEVRSASNFELLACATLSGESESNFTRGGVGLMADNIIAVTATKTYRIPLTVQQELM